MTEHGTATNPATSENGEASATAKEVFSDRLLGLLDDILAGQAPNAGRFCGYCYHPLAPTRETCTHCGRPLADWPAVAAVPRAVIEMHGRRRIDSQGPVFRPCLHQQARAPRRRYASAPPAARWERR